MDNAGVTHELHYIVAYGQIVAIFEKKSSGQSNMYYVHTDHLGSLNVFTDANGSIVQECSYDAWGNRRDPATLQNYTTPPANLITDRGFTGHEHMDAFKLINMNGRIYDPVLGRFLGPDLFVGDPLSTQDYNRYSYVLNNPLLFTDPTGYYRASQIINSYDWDTYYLAALSDGYLGGMYNFMVSFDRQSNNVNYNGKIYWTEQGVGYMDEENNPVIFGIRHIININNGFNRNNNKTLNIGEQGGEIAHNGEREHGESPLLTVGEYAGYVGYGNHTLGFWAEKTADITYKYGQRVNGVVKSAAQLTAENAKLWGTIGKNFAKVGGYTGAIVNGARGVYDITQGNYGKGTFELIKAGGYTTGLYLLGVNPALGGSILLITGIVDLGGDVYEYFSKP